MRRRIEIRNGCKELNLPPTNDKYHKKFLDHQHPLPQITSGYVLQINIFDEEFQEISNIIAVIEIKFC